MNILLINHYAGSTKHGMEYRPFYLAREWVKLGHNVTIVASSFSHLREPIPVNKGSVSESDLEGVHYIWLKTPRYSGNGIGRVLNIFVFIMQLYRFKRMILKRNSPDIVIASSTYPLDIFPAHCICKKAHAKLIFEVHDLWPLSPIELGGISPKHPFMILLQYAENYAYRISDYAISILPKTLEHMVEHGLAKERFVYIPNGIDMDEWKNTDVRLSEELDGVLTELKKNGQFLVGFTGAHGLANALDSLIDAALLLKDEKVTFILVGQGSEKIHLQEKTRKLGLNNIVFLKPLVKFEIPTFLSYMDVLYIGLKAEPLFRFGVCPNKLLDYMMAAKPIIYSIEAGNNMVAESGCGISVPAEDPTAIMEAVKELIKMNPDELEKMGKRGREYIEAEHDYKFLAKKFIQKITDY